MAVDSGTYTPEALDRRRKIAELLLLQASKPREIRSPLQGVGQLGEGLIGGLESGWADRKEREARAANVALTLRAYGIDPGGGDTPPGTAPPAVAPTAGGGFVLPPTEKTYAENELNPIDAKVATPPELAAGIGMTPNDMNVAARTVIGEAGGYQPRDKQAVAAVLLNRARMAGTSPSFEALKPNQFEPWSTSAGRSRMMAPGQDSPAYQDAARSVFMASQADPTGGATHFYSPTAQAALGRKPPNWDTGEGTDIGPHRFFNKPYGNVAAALSAPQASAANAYAAADTLPPPFKEVATTQELPMPPPRPQAPSAPANPMGSQYAGMPYGEMPMPPPRPPAAPPQQVASLPPTAPPTAAPPPAAAAAPPPTQVAENVPPAPAGVPADRRRAQIEAAMSPWTPPGIASSLMSDITPKWTFVPNATHDQYGNAVGAFVDANSRRAVGLDGKPINLSGAQGAAAGSDLTGEDYLKTLPQDRQLAIKAIAEGRAPYPTNLRTPYGQWLQGALAKYKPGLTAEDFKTAERTRLNYTSGPAFNEIKAVNTAIGHAASLYDIGEKLGGTDIAPGYLNPVIQGVKKNIGDKDFQEAQKGWDTYSETLSTEIAKALNGGVPRVSDKEHWRAIFAAADGPVQRRAAIKSAMGVLEGRITPLQQGYAQGLKSAGEPLNVVSKENEAKFDRLLRGEDPNKKESEGGGGKFTPPADWQFSPSRKQYKDPKGNLYDENGKPVK